MGIAGHPVPDRRQDGGQGIADDGGPKMAHVHGFGNVRTAIVHHHIPGVFGAGGAQMRISGHLRHPFGQKGIGQPQVHKAGSGGGYFGETLVHLRQGHYFSRQSGGRPTGRARGGQRSVALKIAQFGPLRREDLAQTTVETQLLEGRAKDLSQLGNQ